MCTHTTCTHTNTHTHTTYTHAHTHTQTHTHTHTHNTHTQSYIRAVGPKKEKTLPSTLQVFIPILSEQSVEDKQLQEQLSLAYVSNSCIFPLGTVRHRFLAPKLNGGA